MTTVELSITQKRFFAMARHDPRMRSPNITSVFELFGDLDPAAVQSALRDAIARHDLLRIGYAKDGLGLEKCADTHDPIARRTLQCDDAALIGQLFQIAYGQQARPFEPGECPLVIGTLLHVNGARWFLVLTIDHMVSDGLSIGMLVREMCFIYFSGKRGRKVPLPKIQGSYFDHVREEGDLLNRAGAERRRWWEQALRGYVPAHGTMPVTAGPIGAAKATIPAAVFNKMIAAARKADFSVSTVVLHAYARALERAAGFGQDIVINKIVSNRPETLRGVFGDFIGLVPTRIRTAGKEAPRLLAEMARDVEAAKVNQLPYWTLTEWLYPELYLHPYGFCNAWFNYFPPHNRRLVDAKEIGVELLGDLTPPPLWAPCSVCLNVQPMLSGEAEVAVLSNTSDVSEQARLAIVREIEHSLEQSPDWLSRL